MVWTNRFYSLFAIWVTALTISLVKASEIEINKQTTQLRKLSAAIEENPSSVLITDAAGRIEFVNAQFTLLTGYTFEEVVGKTPRILKSDKQDPNVHDALWRQIRSGKIWKGELLNKHKSGRNYWASVSISPLYDAEGTIQNFVGVQHDITVAKETELWNSQVTRDLKTRFRFAEILETATDEVETLNQLCRVLNEEAGYHMAWVGVVETDEQKRVVPLAHHGVERPFLENLNISWSENSPRGKGPTGRAVRSCKPQIIRDVGSEPDYEPWRENALKHGVASSIALPLMASDGVFGVLNLYSTRSDAFDSTEVMLLSALSKHMSDGILRLREVDRRLLAEASMRDSEHRFRALFDSMTSGVAIYRAVDDGEDFIFRDMNKAGAVISLVSDREALKGRRVTEAFPAIREFGLLDVFKQVYRTGQPMRHPISYYNDGRHMAWLENSVFRLESGEIATVYDDLTEQKQAEDQLKLAQVSLENTNDMIFWLFPDGRFFRFNQSVCKRLGYSPETLMTMRASDLNPQHPQEKWHEHWAELKAKGSLRFEADLTRVNAPPLPVEISANFMVFNGMEYNMAILRDVSERRQMEADLRLSEDKANQANRAKSEFLAKMSHEIRTPMNSIIGLNYLAQQTELSPQQSGYLKKIDAAAKALLRIINDILDFSKIDAGKLDLEQEPFNLAEVLEQVMDGILAKFQLTRNVELLLSFPFDIPVGLVGDSVRLAQVLTNLGDNAVKFTKKGEVLVAVDLESMTDDHVNLRFTIRDTGIGIASEHVGKLFQSFQQSDNSITRQYGGTGLGLAICRSLVEMMGGHIGLESALGEGTRITFHLGFPRASLSGHESFIHGCFFQGKRVLIMDSNSTSGKVIQRYLNSLQLISTMVTSGQRGIQTLKMVASEGAAYDLVMLDWKLADGNGEDILRQIRGDGHLRNIPVILMGYESERHEIVAWIDGKFNGVFLQKPVIPSRLLECLLAAFGLSSSDVAQTLQTRRDDHLQLQGYHVLLVDDMKENRDLVREILHGRGADVTLAENGQEALDLVARQGAEFDLVLMDMQMPVMDGLEATRQIRRLEPFRNLPIIALTASAMVEEVNQCLAAGISDYLGKPIEVELLFSKLLQWVRGKSIPVLDVRDQEHSHTVCDDNLVPPAEPHPGLDVGASLNRCDGDQAFHAQLIANFIENNHDCGHVVRTLLEKQDYDSAHRQIHKLRNSAGNVSAMEVFALSGECERAILNRDIMTTLSKLSALETCLDVAIASARNFLHQQKNQVIDNAPVVLDDLLSSLDDLDKMLDRRELNAIKLFDQIKPQISSVIAEPGLMMALEKHVERLEIDSAKDALSALIRHLKQ
ncbi:MAG: response regulator [Magnetococcales bacterium]|nr:response regulator [Magnetococcales bacterium]